MIHGIGPELDDEQAERLAAYQKAERENAQLDLLWVVSTPQGRRFVDMLGRDHGLKAQSYVEGDALAMAFNEGRRSVAIELESRLAHPDLAEFADLMTKERRERLRNRNAIVAGS